MSTARNRFGVSILVALVLAVLLTAAPEAAPAPNGAGALFGDDQGFASIENLAAATSTRTQVAMALGAGVPLVIIGCMVRRRLYAEV